MEQRTTQPNNQHLIAKPLRQNEINQLAEQILARKQQGQLPANLSRQEVVIALKQMTESGLEQVTQIVSAVLNSNDFRIQCEEEIEIED